MTARAATCVLIFVLAALGSTMLSSPSSAGPWSLARGEYYSEFSGAIYSTTSMYNFEGDRFAPNLRFESRDFSWYNEFGWRRRVSAVLGLSGRSVTAVSGVAPVEATRTGLTEATVGLRGNLMNRAQALAVEVDWNAPLGYDRELSPILGDGRHRLSASLAYGSSLGHRGFAQVSAGWLYRFLTFGSTDSAFIATHSTPVTSASFATMSADAGVWVTPRFLVGGRYAGQSVLSSSAPESASPFLQPPFGDKDSELDASLHRVGPLLLLRVDDRTDVMAGSFSTFAGKNTYHFNQFWVALAFKQSGLNRVQGFLGNAHP